MGYLLSILMLGILAVIAIGLLRLWKWLTRSLRSSVPTPMDAAQILADLRSSDWDAYAVHLGRPVPDSLTKFYKTDRVGGFLTFKDREDDLTLSFNRIDAEGVIDAYDGIGFEFIELASSDSGDPIFMRSGSSESNAVYLFIHDDPDAGIRKISPDIGAFIASLQVD